MSEWWMNDNIRREILKVYGLPGFRRQEVAKLVEHERYTVRKVIN